MPYLQLSRSSCLENVVEIFLCDGHTFTFVELITKSFYQLKVFWLWFLVQPCLVLVGGFNWAVTYPLLGVESLVSLSGRLRLVFLHGHQKSQKVETWDLITKIFNNDNQAQLKSEKLRRQDWTI